MILNYFLLFIVILLLTILGGLGFFWLNDIIRTKNFGKKGFDYNNIEKLFIKNRKKNIIDYKAYLMPLPTNDFVEKKRMNYMGVKDCALFKMIYDSETNVSGTCIGFGNCAKVCEQEAIYVKDGKVEITASCNGCGKCVDVCPNHLISLTQNVDFSSKVSNIVKKDFKFWKLCFNIFNKG